MGTTFGESLNQSVPATREAKSVKTDIDSNICSHANDGYREKRKFVTNYKIKFWQITHNNDDINKDQLFDTHLLIDNIFFFLDPISSTFHFKSLYFNIYLFNISSSY